jgi:hypothetical protein
MDASVSLEMRVFAPEGGLDRARSGPYNQCMTKDGLVESGRRFCINCDNKHGCKSGTPPCIGEMTKDNVKGRAGKEYLIHSAKISRCKDCPFFRSCWTMEEYDRASSLT